MNAQECTCVEVEMYVPHSWLVQYTRFHEGYVKHVRLFIIQCLSPHNMLTCRMQ